MIPFPWRLTPCAHGSGPLGVHEYDMWSMGPIHRLKQVSVCAIQVRPNRPSCSWTREVPMPTIALAAEIDRANTSDIVFVNEGGHLLRFVGILHPQETRSMEVAISQLRSRGGHG